MRACPWAVSGAAAHCGPPEARSFTRESTCAASSCVVIVVRHHVRPETFGDDRVGIDDRLAHVLVEGLPGRLGRLGEVVEAGTDAPGGLGRLQRVAPAATEVVERRQAGVGRLRGLLLLGRRLLLGDPLIELGPAHHLGDVRGAHAAMPRAAELGAQHLVGAQSRRGDPRARRDPRHGVLLDAPLGDEEGVDHVAGLHLDAPLLVDRQVQRRGLEPELGILELPRELEAAGDHAGLVPVPLLVLGEHDAAPDGEEGDDDRRDRGPEDLEARMPMHGSAVAHVVLAAAPEMNQRVAEDGHHDAEDAERDEVQRVRDQVGALGLLGGLDGEPVDEQEHERERDARDEPTDCELRDPVHCPLPLGFRGRRTTVRTHGS